ncbi:MAG: cobyrinate a,c-diamide synthase [Thaumarchaeota archaeon]|nr:cobyrinate a,c-diamide synthase [Nitrososphaerota archaeon]
MEKARVVIAGTHSGVGKTTISIGIMGALRSKGYVVQGFKAGPDFIDPTYHTLVTGRNSRNLDSWILPKREIVRLFCEASEDADIAIVEGVMGLFDGLDGRNESGSTAQLAKLLRCPVIVVIDAFSMSRSAGATALGYKTFDPDLNIAGFILNKVGSDKHAKMCTEAIESATRLPVVGAVKSDHGITMEERHLGLIPTAERSYFEPVTSRIISSIHSGIDLEKVAEIALNAPPLKEETKQYVRFPKNRSKMWVALDQAFSFYYNDNITLLSSCGVDIEYFSPLVERSLPSDVCGLYLGGGFPEVYAIRLAKNTAILEAIRKASADGMPIYAECGGLMYLTNSITDFDGRKHEMTQVFDAETLMTRRLTLGYTAAEVEKDNILFPRNASVKGHEFHYSKILDVSQDVTYAYSMKRGVGIDGTHDGLIQDNTLASYMHLHFAYDRSIAKNLVSETQKYSRR